MLSQEQVGSILANAFLCTFPKQGAREAGCGFFKCVHVYHIGSSQTFFFPPWSLIFAGQMMCGISHLVFTLYSRDEEETSHQTKPESSAASSRTLIESLEKSTRYMIFDLRSFLFVLLFLENLHLMAPAQGKISFTRRVLKEAPDWETSSCPIRRVAIHHSGLIEDEGRDCLQGVATSPPP